MRTRLQWMLGGLLTLAMTMTLASCGGGATVDDLTTFDGDGFTILLPGKPERKTESVTTQAGPTNVNFFFVESGDSLYGVSFTEIQEGLEYDLKGVLQGSATSTRGTLRDSAATTYQGYPARDGRIAGITDPKGNKGTVFTRAIIAKGRVYQLQFISQGDDVQSPGEVYPKVRDSLKIE